MALKVNIFQMKIHSYSIVIIVIFSFSLVRSLKLVEASQQFLS